MASIWDNIWQGDEFGEQEPGEAKESASNKDAIVFLIDCGPSMFAAMDSGQKPFQNALECVSVAVTQKLISSPDDEVAVVLYATGLQHGDFPGVYVLFDFDKPSAQLIEKLDELRTENGYTMGHWETSNPGSEFPLSDAFWTASSVLSRIKNAAERRVWLFTDEDTPHQDDDLLGRARARLEDYRSSGVRMSLFAFQRGGGARPFDLRPFYRLCPDPDIEESTNMWTAESRLDLMLRKTNQKAMKKRSLGSLKFTLAPGVEFAVKLYTMLRSADQVKHVYLDPVTMYPVKPKTKWICGDTGQHLRPAQMKKYFPLGEYKVVFEPEEIARLKFLYPPGITLLGFKSLSSLSDVHNLTHASFLFCDDSSIKGSGLVFKLLLQKCIVRQQFALVRLVTRSNAVPRLAALYPGREEYDGDTMKTPSGFHVIPLPWADEMRELEVKQNFGEATPTMEQCMAASKVCECLVSDFEPDLLPNPALQKHFAVLQTYALSKGDFLGKWVDTIEPDKEGMEHFKPILDEFKNVVFPEGYEGGGDGEVKKEKGAGRKRAAPGKEVEGYEGDWGQLVSSDANMNQVTVPQLKLRLKHLGLPVSGTKGVLWERLKTAVGAAGGGGGGGGGGEEEEEEDRDETPAAVAPKKKRLVKREKVKQEVEEEF